MRRAVVGALVTAAVVVLTGGKAGATEYECIDGRIVGSSAGAGGIEFIAEKGFKTTLPDGTMVEILDVFIDGTLQARYTIPADNGSVPEGVPDIAVIFWEETEPIANFAGEGCIVEPSTPGTSPTTPPSSPPLSSVPGPPTTTTPSTTPTTSPPPFEPPPGFSFEAVCLNGKVIIKVTVEFPQPSPPIPNQLQFHWLIEGQEKVEGIFPEGNPLSTFELVWPEFGIGKDATVLVSGPGIVSEPLVVEFLDRCTITTTSPSTTTTLPHTGLSDTWKTIGGLAGLGVAAGLILAVRYRNSRLSRLG
jgi:hypothetical protein